MYKNKCNIYKGKVLKVFIGYHVIYIYYHCLHKKCKKLLCKQVFCFVIYIVISRNYLLKHLK